MNETIEEKPTGVEELYEKLKSYGETRFALIKLQLINKVSGFFSTLITTLIISVIMFVVILCISVGLALLIGSWLGNAYWGFFIISGIYIIIGLILYSSRGSLLKTPVSDKLIKEMIE